MGWEDSLPYCVCVECGRIAKLYYGGTCWYTEENRERYSTIRIFNDRILSNRTCFLCLPEEGKEGQKQWDERPDNFKWDFEHEKRLLKFMPAEELQYIAIRRSYLKQMKDV